MAKEVKQIPFSGRHRTSRRVRKGRWNLKKLITLLFMGYFIYAMVSSQIQLTKLHRQQEELQNKINALRVKNDLYRKDIEYIKSDEYIEKVAREELGLIKPGEILYMPVPKQ